MPESRPDRGGQPRSLLRSAAWTGAGAAIACATLGIVVVAICWLPVSGPNGRTHSAIAGGLLAFLAGLHGGITIDGTSASWLPLGMTLIVARVAWRAGVNLGEAAEHLEEDDPRRLVRAAAVQAATFTLLALIAVPFAHLGTSHAPYLGVFIGALLLFAVFGGAAFVRSSALADEVTARLPPWAAPSARAAAAALLVYVAAGALLVAASMVWHHGRVEALSREVGGGWGSIPILLLGLLAVPNAVVDAASYLAGPGMTMGTGGHVTAVATAHGVLPTFPLLGALPAGHGASAPVWALMALTPVAAGVVMAWLVTRTSAERFAERVIIALASSAGAGLAALVAAWLAGGGIGSGHLSVLGAPPGWFGLLVTGALAAVSVASLALVSGWRAMRAGRTPKLDLESVPAPTLELHVVEVTEPSEPDTASQAPPVAS